MTFPERLDNARTGAAFHNVLNDIFTADAKDSIVCPVCRRTTISRNGVVRRHRDRIGRDCPMSGHDHVE